MRLLNLRPLGAHGRLALAFAVCGATGACQSDAPPRGLNDGSASPPSRTSVPAGSAAQTGSPMPTGAAPGPQASEVAANTASDDVRAAEVYAQRCALCHGPHGQGNGVAAQNLKPQPRNLQEAGWQDGSTDADIRAIILKGGAGVGKSMMMPANPDLAMAPATVEGLVHVVRGFRK
jgi:mono/diheme cytochrome c family protein